MTIAHFFFVILVTTVSIVLSIIVYSTRVDEHNPPSPYLILWAGPMQRPTSTSVLGGVAGILLCCLKPSCSVVGSLAVAVLEVFIVK